MKTIISVIILTLFACTGSAQGDNQESLIRPGEVWLDTEGNPINAHGGGILYHGATYYWYGEIKSGETWLPEVNSDWEGYRTQAGGVSCYSSRDLVHWQNEGVALAPVSNDPSHDLHTSKIIERPKVLFNKLTQKFVMWMHIDSEDYGYARAGVAVSDTPRGPFRYVRSMRPNGQMSRDMTLFQDEDGKAYHVYSSENNATMYVSLLSDDYLEPSGSFTRNFIGASREAPAVFRYQDKYYIISSACTGWNPNPAEIAVSDSLLGTWEVLGNPCVGPGSEETFQAQSTCVFPVEGKSDAYIFMADRWNKRDLEDSRYIWLPMFPKEKGFEIQWKDQWDTDLFPSPVN